MEELQDAIEDAQYLSAMHDESPKPTIPWPKYKDEELNAFIDQSRSDNPMSVDLEGISSGCLGFYMFTKFVTDRGNSRAVCLANFLLDVATFRTGAYPADQSAAASAVSIIEKYLIAGGKPDLSADAVSEKDSRPPSLFRKLLSDTKDAPVASSSNPGAETAEAVAAAVTKGAWKSVIVDTPVCNLPLAAGRGSKAFSASTALPVLPAGHSGSSSGSSSSSSSSSGGGGSDSGSSGGEGDTALTPLGIRSNDSIVVGLVAQVASLRAVATAITAAAAVAAAAASEKSTSRGRRGSRTGGSVNELTMSNSAPTMQGAAAAAVAAAGAAASSSPQSDAPSTTGANGGVSERCRFDALDQLVFACLRDVFFEPFQASASWHVYFSYLKTASKSVVEQDFALFRVLGRGGFGLVNGCKRSTSGKLYAMKQMNKLRVKLKKAEAFCLNERNILAAVHSPFIVCLKYAFATPRELYLILDLMMGGDLGYHLQRKGKFSNQEALYYAARIVAGMAALHELNIVYRDLKPENVLMDENGFTKISDLGLACKMGKSGLSGACGTRGYWAPEMLKKDEAGKRERYFLQVDWFSFGCCLYEFLYGIGPFRTDQARKWGSFAKTNKEEKDRAIDLATMEMDPEFDPLFFDAMSTSILRGLLTKDPSKRLGAKGPAEVMAHPYFSSVNWDSLARAAPPIKPPRDINMATQSEIGSFKEESGQRKVALDKADQKRFDGWEFVSMPAFQEEVVEFLQYEAIHGELKPMAGGGDCCCLC